MDEKQFSKHVEEFFLRMDLFSQKVVGSRAHRSLLEEATDYLRDAMEELSVAGEELRQQNEELVDSRNVIEAERQRYQNLFDFAPDGYLVTDIFGKILEANQATTGLFNCSPLSLQGKLLVNFISLADRKTFRKQLNSLLARSNIPITGEWQSNKKSDSRETIGEKMEWELRLKPDGNPPVDAVVRVTVLQGQEEPRLYWLLRDISQQKRAQEAIKQSEARFRSLAEITSAVIFIVRDHKICYVNRAASAISGYEVKELLDLYFFQIVHPDSRGVLKEAEVGTPWKGDSSPNHSSRNEIQLMRKDGTECWMDVTAGRMEFEGSPAWILTAYDITQRIHSEEARKQLLRRLVSVQEEQRRALSRELHDQMGQSLNALILGLKHLKDPSSSQETRDGELCRLLKITEDLVREAHTLALELRPSSLDDLGLDAALANYAETWSANYKIAVDFQVIGSHQRRLPPQVATTIYRIIQEGLTNVLKHAKARSVSVILDKHPDQVRVILEDDGQGFDVEEKERNFGREIRLGLLGMKERAEQVGGRLDIESAPGRGSTIFLLIPLHEEDQEEDDG